MTVAKREREVSRRGGFGDWNFAEKTQKNMDKVIALP